MSTFLQNTPRPTPNAVWGTHAQAPGSDRAMMRRRMRATDPNRRATSARASPLAAGATNKDSDSRDRAGWDAHSELLLVRPPGAVPPVASSTCSHEQDHDPGDNASQPGSAESTRARRDRPDGDARGRERAVEVLGRGRGGHACGLVLRDLRRHAGSQPPASPARPRSMPEARLHGTAERGCESWQKATAERGGV